MARIATLVRCEPVIHEVIQYLDLKSIINLAKACTEFRAYMSSPFIFQRMISNHPEAIKYVTPTIETIQSTRKEMMIDEYFLAQDKLRLLEKIDNRRRSGMCGNMRDCEFWLHEVNFKDMCLVTHKIPVPPHLIPCSPHVISDSRMFFFRIMRDRPGNEIQVHVFDRISRNLIEIVTAKWCVLHNDDQIVFSCDRRSLTNERFRSFAEPWPVRNSGLYKLIPTGSDPAVRQSLRNKGNSDQYESFTFNHEIVVGNKVISLIENRQVVCYQLKDKVLTVAWSLDIISSPRDINLLKILTQTGVDVDHVIVEAPSHEDHLARLVELKSGMILKSVSVRKKSLVCAVNYTGKPMLMLMVGELGAPSFVSKRQDVRLIDFEGDCQIRVFRKLLPAVEAPQGLVQVDYPNKYNKDIMEYDVDGYAKEMYWLIPIKKLSHGSVITKDDVVTLPEMPGFQRYLGFIVYLGNYRYFIKERHKLKLLDFGASDPQLFFEK